MLRHKLIFSIAVFAFAALNLSTAGAFALSTERGDLLLAANQKGGGNGLPLQRVAVVGLVGNAGKEAEAAIAKSIAAYGHVEIVDPDQVRAAVRGGGYNGSINLSTYDARSLAAAIGCDFFVTGKAETVTRSEAVGEVHVDAYAGVMIADGRSGALVDFDFVTARASSSGPALASLTANLSTAGVKYVESMLQFRMRLLAEPAVQDQVEEIPTEGSPQAAGFKPPEFLNKTKPEYTAQADLAGISATVEAEAEFLMDGKVGRVQIVKWAGFGLDQSAETAIRGLRFKPATRDGKAVSVRALIRYNFRQTTQPMGSAGHVDPSDNVGTVFGNGAAIAEARYAERVPSKMLGLFLVSRTTVSESEDGSAR